MSQATHRGDTSTKRPPARPDIQGMRALAVLAVVLYHADVPFITGGFVGVDFFFVLSGFLITGLLLRELETTHRIRLSQFWGRRARRLIPASALVLVVTVVASGRILPFLDRKPVSIDALWATAFGANWRFAQQQTDYLDADRALSPIQHFWSLGVEEQFYAVVPLVFLGAALVARHRVATAGAARGVRDARLLLGVVLATVLVVSLAYCVHLTGRNQPYAFFGTHARAWQLAAGGLLALAAPRLGGLGRPWAAAASLAGFALFGASLVFLSDGGTVAGHAYPSLLAVLPTAAAVLLLVGGTARTELPTVFTRVLSLRPLTAVGDISYSLYLWHWPFIVLGVIYLDDDSVRTKLMLAVGAVLAATATYHLVEDPIRRSRLLGVRAKPVVSVAMGVVLLAAVVPVARHVANQEFVITARPPAPERDAPGASRHAVPAEPVDDTIVGLRPPVDEAAEDEDDILEIHCGLATHETRIPDRDHCTWEKGDRSVIVLGDSIAAASTPAVRAAARQERWTVTTWTKSDCTIADVVGRYKNMPGEFTECTRWRDAVIDRTIAEKPDLVLLGMSQGALDRLVSHRDGSDFTSRRDERREAAEGLTRTVRRLKDGGLRVALVDSPQRSPFDVVGCLMDEQSVSACTWKRSRLPSTTSLVARSERVHLVPTTDRYCSRGTCQPVIDRVVTIRDDLHFTTTFAKRLAPLFAHTLRQAARDRRPR
ncbi:acyltransferase family protein [Aeromicrobium chenweiae]|uniref:Uncharacterized protein n=1 Tax=Aeromicrobium chenweiae TaxID=2079793 RepID=A0A2S0WIF4_9ACTN|nr:acyltransferase family protein [Aeromicrobium chenweiae]AWB91115.1 hypothetical protein C3E78_02135 [Aeromicrobium chenweiae]TGN31635.1 acyltransferase [Aeromicrobium chenweiae]